MSDSSAPILAPTLANEAIHSFSDFIRCVMGVKDGSFGHRNAGVSSIELVLGDTIILALSSRLFLDETYVRGLLETKQSSPLGILCLASSDELEKMPAALSQYWLCQSMALPSNSIQLQYSLAGFFRILSHNIEALRENRRITDSAEEVKYVLSMSRELNGERDIPKLLNLILKRVREITHADAGSIYTIEQDNPQNPNERHLMFRFTQNDSIEQKLISFTLPINDRSVVGNAILNACTINIPDLYKLSSDRSKNPFGVAHDRSWDAKTGYESHSMLTLPIFDISHSPIGVVQLINCKRDMKMRLKTPQDFEEQVVAFDERAVEYAEIVATQAGIALENARMQANIQDLFDGFVNASVRAIEMRDPTTSGHSHRVAQLTLGLAEAINRCDAGAYKATTFNEDQMLEIRYASLLHDFGKLGVREHVLVKAKKLYPDQFLLIEERFNLIRAQIEVQFLKDCLRFEQNPQSFPFGVSVNDFVAEKNMKFAQLDRFFKFILEANEPTILEQGGFDRLKDISAMTFVDPLNKTRPYISQSELKALSISRGSLTAEEFAEIQSHVVHTYEFLRQIPWGGKLANVPQIAAKHHEKLDGSGYPTSAAGSDIPVQSRLMTIADIYDALTSPDRPYKKSMPYRAALAVLESDAVSGRIDAEAFRIFVESKTHLIVIDRSLW